MADDMDMDAVFAALAHKTRRRLLDALKARPGAGVGEIASAFDVSRIAIMKHLAVLEGANLVISQKDGRTRRLWFNAAPIRMIYDRWTADYSAYWAGELTGDDMTAARILIDGDACPVKEEVYKVALRHQTPAVLVTNGGVRIPDHPLITRKIVGDAFDAADDFIAANADARAIVVTGDILLAERCLKQGAAVIAPNGKPFTTSSIGAAIAMRAIMADIRGSGDPTAGGGARPFSREDRSRFLQALDRAIVSLPRR